MQMQSLKKRNKTHRQVDVAVVLAQSLHDLREAFVDGNVQGCALGVVPEIAVGPFADQEAGYVCLVPRQ